MPYNVQQRGSSYIVVDDSGKVVGTHESKQEAVNHQRALYANVPDARKNSVGSLYEMLTPVEKAYHDALVQVVSQHGYFDKGAQSVWVGYEGAQDNDKASIGVVCGNCSFYKQDGGCQIVSFKVEAGGYCRLAAIPDNLINVEAKQDMEMEDVEKKAPCWDGYVQRGMKEKDGRMVPNCVPATTKAYEGCGCQECLKEDIACPECDFCAGEMAKAEETYTPTSGMKAAARRALKWKEDGKATGAGTAVGWGRASDIVAGRSMSLSTVKRMYSFFSRHEVDKKGKDFYNTSNPSNGRIMWDAWGGDAGFSWSRKIVEREKANKVWETSPFNLR